ncbi:MAG: hypothetical protein Q3993_07120 [Filifactor alocis]|nr:hypothetical protein [Filifactor alocis]
MKNSRKIMVLVLSLCMLITSMPVNSYAATIDFNDVQPMSNRYYYITEKGETRNHSRQVASSDPNLKGGMMMAVTSFLSLNPSTAVPVGITTAVFGFGNYLYNFNYDGRLDISVTMYKKYKVDRLTKKKIYVPSESYRMVTLKGYANRGGKMQLVRNYTHKLRNK